VEEEGGARHHDAHLHHVNVDYSCQA
jgi:hypothetical protein